ncbi:hypothetical protein EJB05_45473, partial [Eragrostis curvula]
MGQEIRRDMLIIDTDPGIGESLLSFATAHSLISANNVRVLEGQCERAGHPHVPVAEGSAEPLKGEKPLISDFVHGSDGIGNLFLPAPTGKKIEESAAEFLVKKVSQFPGEVTVLALGPLTNLALILGDPEAADMVFTSGADIVVVGLNITHQVYLTDEDLLELRKSKGKHAQLLSDMGKFYRDFSAEYEGIHGCFLHDPTSFTALVHPELFTFKKGVVRVGTQGIFTGHTLMDQRLIKSTPSEWSTSSAKAVALSAAQEVDAQENWIAL